MVSTFINNSAKTQFRTTKHSILDPVVNVVPRIVVATAQINQTAFSYPLAQLTVDNTFGWDDVKPGMMVFIGDEAGSFNVGYGVVRKAPGETTLYIDAKSKGDPGLTYGQANILRALANDMHITIIKFWPIWGELSRVSAQGGIFKFYDRVYAGELSALPPVINIGSWRQAYVDEHTNTARFVFDASNSFAYLNRSMSAYQWNLDGGTIVAGTGGIITGEFTPGFYVVECTGYDNAGEEHTARTYVWANTRSGANAPFSITYGTEVRSIRSHRKGGDLALTVQGDVSDVLFPGCGILYSEKPRYGYSAPLQPEVVFDRFVGYLASIDWTKTRQRQSRELKVVSPLDKAKELASVTQYLKEVRQPNNWTEITFASPATALDYLFRYHFSALLAQHDFLTAGNFDVLRKKTFVFQSEGLQAQVGMLEQLALGNIGSREDGATLFCLLPTIMPPADSDSVPILFDWATSDYGVELRYRYSLKPPVAYIKGFSFSYDGGNVIPWGAGAPGKIQSQGTGKPTMPTFIVPTTRSGYNAAAFGGLPYAQYRTMEIVGQQFALDNREIKGVSLSVNRNLDIAAPADLRYWHMLLDDDLLTPADTYPRMLPEKVTRTYRRRGNSTQKRISADFEFEAFGQPGIPIDVERGGAGVYLNPDGWTIDFPSLYDPDFIEYDLEPTDFGLLVANNSYGAKGRSLNALDESVIWEKLSDSIEGLVKDIEWLPSASVPTVLIATYDAESQTARLYEVEDIDLDTPVVTDVKSWEIIGTPDGELRLATSDTTDNAIVLWKSTSGMKLIRNTGSDWSAASVEQVGTGTGAGDFNAEVAGDDLFIITAPSMINTVFKMYYASGSGSWTEVADFPGDNVASRIPSPVIERVGADSVYMMADLIDSTPQSETLDSADLDEETLSVGWCPSSYLSCAWLPNSFTLGRAINYGMPDADNGTLTRLSGLLITVAVQTHYLIGAGNPDSSPDPYYPPLSYPTALNLTAHLIVKGKDDLILYEEEREYDSLSRSENAETIFSVSYIPSPSSFDTVRVNKAVNFDITFGSPLDVKSIEIRVFSETRDGFVTSGGEGGFIDRGGGVKLPIYFMSEPGIELYKTHEVIDGKRLYYVTDVDGVSPTWNDRSIGSGYFPETFTALAVDPNSASKLAMIASNSEGNKRLWTSDNGGISWTDRGETQMIGVKRSDDALLLWGYGGIFLSEDLNMTRYNRIGDWLDTVGPVGDVKKVLALFEVGS